MNKGTEQQTADKIKSLLLEFDIHRDSIKEMVEHLEELRKHIISIFPEKLDSRYQRFFEEKVKALTGLFNSLLDMKKEVIKSVKDEIEIRRKMVRDDLIDSSASIEDLLDIRKMAKTIEKFQKKNDEMKLKIVKPSKEEIANGGHSK
jgi:predicted urease superfamily metal-dependent hydrolase